MLIIYKPEPKCKSAIYALVSLSHKCINQQTQSFYYAFKTSPMVEALCKSRSFPQQQLEGNNALSNVLKTWRLLPHAHIITEIAK